jgi:hypothetical protein
MASVRTPRHRGQRAKRAVVPVEYIGIVEVLPLLLLVVAVVNTNVVFGVIPVQGTPQVGQAQPDGCKQVRICGMYRHLIHKNKERRLTRKVVQPRKSGGIGG